VPARRSSLPGAPGVPSVPASLPGPAGVRDLPAAGLPAPSPLEDLPAARLFGNPLVPSRDTQDFANDLVSATPRALRGMVAYNMGFAWTFATTGNPFLAHASGFGSAVAATSPFR
jgi:hypothetical protein